MNQHCQIPAFIDKLYAGLRSRVAYLGGSVTLASGASNTAETSWRALFQKYLHREFHRKYYCTLSEIFSGLGACSSSIATFMVPRNVLRPKATLTFVEFCLNDRHVPDKAAIEKGMEGIIRQLLTAKDRSDVVILGAGTNPVGRHPDGISGLADHSLHRRIAEHYDLPFIDLQTHIHRTLQQRGQTWEGHVMTELEDDPLYHLNDYGNEIYFEGMREAFEQQLALYAPAGKREYPPIPEPLFSDEFQFVKLIDPAAKNSSLTLEGEWDKKPEGLVPWYCDHVLMGRPGARMTLRFCGTAVMVWGLLHYNGLKVEAVLDGKRVRGPYLRNVTEFCKGFMLDHGMPPGEHVLELTVGKAVKMHNRLPDPTAQIGYLGVACKPE